MHIFYCNNIFESPRTGGEIFYAHLVHYLQEREDVNLLLPTEKDLYYLNDCNSMLGMNQWFFRRFAKLSPGTVVIENSCHAFAFFISNWLSKLRKRKLRFVVDVHEILYPEPIGWEGLKHRVIFGSFLRSTDAIVTNSRFIKDEVMGFGVCRRKVSVNYVPGQKLSRGAIVKNSRENGPPQILCVSNIRLKKGQEYLVRALHLLRDLDFRAILVGMNKEEEYASGVRSLIKEYGLDERVKLMGWLSGDDLARAYETASVFVLPSLYEPLGIVVQEAMSFELPIVATNVGGISEQVTDGQEALLVPPADSQAMANALRRLLVDPALRTRLGRNAVLRLRTMPTWDEVCERFYGVLVTTEKR